MTLRTYLSVYLSIFSSICAIVEHSLSFRFCVFSLVIRGRRGKEVSFAFFSNTYSMKCSGVQTMSEWCFLYLIDN